MSTNATISIETETGLETIFLHWDGGRQSQDILIKHYNTTEKVKALIALGNISNLEASIECPEGHNFDNRIKGYTTFYGRDRNQADQEAQKHTHPRMINRQQYNYLWTGEEWVTF